VLSVFARLFGSGRRRRPPVTCFIRENGPIAYQVDLFGGSPRESADTLLNAGLSWAWRSGAREWTHLTRISLSAFLGDLPGGALIVGVDGDLPTHLTDAAVKDWVRRFCRAEPTPLAIAASASSGRQILFVQQHASDAVNGLLDTLRLDRRAAARSAYARLGPASLESLAERL
jgi:hypothetical protein